MSVSGQGRALATYALLLLRRLRWPPSGPQLLHEPPGARHVLQVRPRLPRRHVPLRRDDVLERPVDVGPHPHGAADVHARPPGVNEVPRLLCPLPQEVLDVHLPVLLPAERQV